MSMTKDKNDFIDTLDENEIFVFGSNLAGRHEGGAARTALTKFGAVYGQGIGLQGQSWAIPTLDENFKKLPLSTIQAHLYDLSVTAKENPDISYYLTSIGTGIAGFSKEQIEEILPKFPPNVIKI